MSCHQHQPTPWDNTKNIRQERPIWHSCHNGKTNKREKDTGEATHTTPTAHVTHGLRHLLHRTNINIGQEMDFCGWYYHNNERGMHSLAVTTESPACRLSWSGNEVGGVMESDGMRGTGSDVGGMGGERERGRWGYGVRRNGKRRNELREWYDGEMKRGRQHDIECKDGKKGHLG